ncbi:probable low-specificity L-threonine aldolase 2 [Fopius arisanus]|uniref:Probable low-specificity L-threonine aldolase 2 n=1 Tax=Fopius arisanus TaxID=64838 RepID=A0A9R1TJ89_9HYME|nr:PREDICTED: probable low-specificity L-threonine aldolase 2 [Fopius arisanus]
MSYGSAQTEKNYGGHVITVDFRSDTVTKPCRVMRQAMFDAEVGDDVYHEDPTTKRLEEYVADLMGKQAALFVSSGTMGNLLSTMVHCNTRGCEMFLGQDAHMVHHEQGSAAQIANVTICPIPNNPDGTFDLKQVRLRLKDPANVHSSISRMLAVENTHNGKILPLKWIREAVAFGKRHGLKLHMDGARIWYASIIGGTPIRDIVDGFDSVTFCLSKLGAPVGSMLCGSREFITQARRMRKVLGGGMRQIGVLTACALVALENLPKIDKEQVKVAAMMKAVNELESDIFKIHPIDAQTNMAWISVEETDEVTAPKFAKRLGEIEDDHEDDQIRVLAWAVRPRMVRLVFHLDITEEGARAAQRKIRYVIKQMDPKFNETLNFIVKNKENKENIIACELEKKLYIQRM